MADSMPPHPPSFAQPARIPLLDWLLLIGGLVTVLAVLVWSPGGLLDKADHVGYAVCHQIPVRSFFFGGRQLPLCARCSGQYLGALAGLTVLVALGRGRSGLMPTRPILLLLVLFLILWAVDGFNSFLTLVPGLPHAYEPRNILRVTTGALQGIALIALVLPMFNTTLWAHSTAQPVLASWRQVGALLLAVAAIAAVTSSEIDAVLYPVALTSVAGTLMMLTLVNTMLWVVLLRRVGYARRWQQALPLLVAGLATATLEVLILNLIRAWLTTQFGLPY